MGAPEHLWVGSIVVECREFSRMMDFWKAALGYENREPPSEDWVVLHDPRDSGPNISLQKVAEAPDEDYRFHFDLYSSDPEGEVRRLLGLGATLREAAREGRDFVTLADPDGNPFDVVDARGWRFGQRSPRSRRTARGASRPGPPPSELAARYLHAGARRATPVVREPPRPHARSLLVAARGATERRSAKYHSRIGNSPSPSVRSVRSCGAKRPEVSRSA